MLLILVILLGAGIALYPFIADTWNRMHAAHVITNYEEEVSHMDSGEADAMLQEAEQYNKELSARGLYLRLSKDEQKEYDRQLRFDESGLMGMIDIPSINVSLPVCHGADEEVLKTSIGHLPGTSLPVGGPSTHAVLSGHRGLPSAKLFSDLDKVKEGDYFILRVLNRILYYQVDQIQTVLPAEISSLQIQEGQDLVTLVTCTPYGVNTHRLLVRGHRVDHMTGNAVQTRRAVSDAEWVNAILIGTAAALLLMILLAGICIAHKLQRHRIYQRRHPYFSDRELLDSEDIGTQIWRKRQKSIRKRK